MRIEDGKLRGKRVIASDGRHLGDVEGVEMETDDWRVVWFVVKLQREALDVLRVKKPLFGTPKVRIGPDRIKTVSDTVLLNVDTSEVTALLGNDSEV